MTNIDTTFLTDTAKRIDTIETYLTENKIVALWDQTHEDLFQETGVRLGSTYWDSPVSNSRVMYQMHFFDFGSLTFAGTDPEGDYHSYSIPFEFIDPATRPQAIETLRAQYHATATEQHAKEAQAEDAKRARDEAEFQRLGRALGHLDQTQTDATPEASRG